MSAINSLLKRLPDSESSDLISFFFQAEDGIRYFWKKKPDTTVKQMSVPITVDAATAIAAMSGNYQHALKQITDSHNTKDFANFVEQVKKAEADFAHFALSPTLEKQMAAIADFENSPAAKRAAETIKEFEAAAGKQLAKLKADGLI